MEQLALKHGDLDLYSNEKLNRLKAKHPDLKFSTYCMFGNYGLSDLQIKKMYGISTNEFQYFKKGHMTVLKEVRKW